MLATFTLAALSASAPLGASAALGGDVQQAAGAADTITLAIGRPVVIAADSLTVELIEVKDGRCPSGAQCIWAGHATLTLRVGKAGVAAEVVTVGTKAPASRKLPFDATYAGYRLHLVSLKPGKSVATTVALARYRAKVEVSKP